MRMLVIIANVLPAINTALALGRIRTANAAMSFSKVASASFPSCISERRCSHAPLKSDVLQVYLDLADERDAFCCGDKRFFPTLDGAGCNKAFDDGGAVRSARSRSTRI